MSATVHLAEPVAGEERIDCEEVRLVGDVVWAVPGGEERELVVPRDNVLGVEGETVHQEVEDLESPGGRFRELVTDVE